MSNSLTRNELAKIFKDHRVVRVFENALNDISETLPETIAGAALNASQALSLAASVLEALAAAVDDLPPGPEVPPVGSIAEQDSDNVALTGGTIAGIRSPLGIRSSGANFDLQLTVSEAITANRALVFSVGNADRTVTFFGNTRVPVFSQNVTFSGPTAARTVTLPDSDTTVPAATQLITFAGLTAGRTVTLPDANITVARKDAAQTFTGDQTFSDTVYANSVQVTAGVSANTVNAGATEVGTFGCNGVSAQSSYALPAAAVDAATTQALANAIRAALIANGIGS